MEELKILIPLIIFLFGLLINSIQKRTEERKAAIGKAAGEIVELASSWYGQLQKLGNTILFEKDNGTINKELYNYITSRELLPKYILTLQLLKKFKETKEFVLLAEEFLALVANLDPDIGSDGSIQKFFHCGMPRCGTWSSGQTYWETINLEYEDAATQGGNKKKLLHEITIRSSLGLTMDNASKYSQYISIVDKHCQFLSKESVKLII